MAWSDHRRQIVEDFSFIENRQERLAAIVERANAHPPLGPADRTDANRVLGCVSAVWLKAQRDGDVWRFHGDADGPLVRGLVVFLCDAYSGATSAEIAADPSDPLEELGVPRDLSPTRRNGLQAVRARIRALTQA